MKSNPFMITEGNHERDRPVAVGRLKVFSLKSTPFMITEGNPERDRPTAGGG
ncbi:MAG: hypothetical protein V2I34_12690 [Bacteroidales bacterium]|nr:hypothetical protein [Bacteroidales bacterium]